MPTERSQKLKIWRIKNRDADKRLDEQLRYKYGITLEFRNNLLIAQEYKCAVCKRSLDDTGKKRRLIHTDHDHLTGRIRGMLCARCNLFLGMLETSELLEQAQAYLNDNKLQA